MRRRYRVFASESGQRAAIGESVAIEREEIRHAAERPHVNLRARREGGGGGTRDSVAVFVSCLFVDDLAAVTATNVTFFHAFSRGCNVQITHFRRAVLRGGRSSNHVLGACVICKLMATLAGKRRLSGHLLPRDFALVLVSASACDATSHVAYLPFAVAALQNIFNLVVERGGGETSRKQRSTGRRKVFILQARCRNASTVVERPASTRARGSCTLMSLWAIGGV